MAINDPLIIDIAFQEVLESGARRHRAKPAAFGRERDEDDLVGQSPQQEGPPDFLGYPVAETPLETPPPAQFGIPQIDLEGGFRRPGGGLGERPPIAGAQGFAGGGRGARVGGDVVSEAAGAIPIGGEEAAAAARALDLTARAAGTVIRAEGQLLATELDPFLTDFEKGVNNINTGAQAAASIARTVGGPLGEISASTIEAANLAFQATQKQEVTAQRGAVGFLTNIGNQLAEVGIKFSDFGDQKLAALGRHAIGVARVDADNRRMANVIASQAAGKKFDKMGEGVMTAIAHAASP